MFNTVLKYIISGAVVCMSSTPSKIKKSENIEFSIEEISKDEKLKLLTASASKTYSGDLVGLDILNSHEMNLKGSNVFFQTLGTEVRYSELNHTYESSYLVNSINSDISNEAIYLEYFKTEEAFDLSNNDYLRSYDIRISEYDDLIQAHAENINWDWRLLAALIYHESRFNPEALSNTGANGLMQIMPGTAVGLGVENVYDPNESIKGGTRYLKIVWDRFDEVKDRTQRIKFCLAAYNCGYSHVVDARNLAREEGLKSNVWDNNVEEIILKLSNPEYYNKPIVKYGYVRGKETYAYVEKIFDRYDHYRQLVSSQL